MKIIYDFKENGVRRTTLRAERAISYDALAHILDKIPKSHFRYAFTMKENRNSMLPYLKRDSAYYDKLLQISFNRTRSLRTCIYTEELDSHNVRHIHGVMTTNKHLHYKSLMIPGVHLHFTKMRNPLKTLTTDEIELGGPIIPYTVRNSEPRPPPKEYWEKYILKGNKRELKIILRELKSK